MGPTDIALLCILFILLLLSAFFSSAETAFTMVTTVKLRMLLDQEAKHSKTLEKVLNEPSKMLNTVLIGNNLVNISASSITTIVTQHLFSNIYVSVGVGLLTLLIIIFGEIIPKSAARLKSEKLALAYSGPIWFLMKVFTPIIFILNLISSFFLKLFRVKVNLNESKITEDELRTIMDVSEEEGLLESEEISMINNVFDFGGSNAKDIMIPKVDITMIPDDITFEELIKTVKVDKYTRMPVYSESTDNIIGILNIKDLIIRQITEDCFDIKSLLRTPIFTFPMKELNDLLVEMRRTDSSMCIVLDEYGQVDGLITLEDIIEEIVGEIRDEFDESEHQVIRQVGPNRYIIEGSINLDDFNDALDTSIDSESFESLGGLIIEKLERIPQKGDVVRVDNLILKVVKMDDKRIEYVSVKVLKAV